MPCSEGGNIRCYPLPPPLFFLVGVASVLRLPVSVQFERDERHLTSVSDARSPPTAPEGPRRRQTSTHRAGRTGQAVEGDAASHRIKDKVHIKADGKADE